MLKIPLGMMVFIGRMTMGLPARGVLIVPLIFGAGMRVVFLGMTFCSVLKHSEEDMSGISFVFRKAKRNCSAEIIRQDGILFVRGEGTARGAPTICLNKRLSQFFGEARFGKDFVALRLDTLPPVLVWIFHGPTAQFSDDEYVDALGDIVKAFHEMTGKTLRAMFALVELISTVSWVCVVESPEGFAKVKDLVKLKELEKSMAFLPSEV